MPETIRKKHINIKISIIVNLKYQMDSQIGKYKRIIAYSIFAAKAFIKRACRRQHFTHPMLYCPTRLHNKHHSRECQITKYIYITNCVLLSTAAHYYQGCQR